MDKLQLKYLYSAYNYTITDELKKKQLILEIFDDCRNKKVHFIPDIYHMNDELDELEKRYKYYILKDTNSMSKSDYILDFLLMGILMFERMSSKLELGIELNGFTKQVILNKKEYKELVILICDKYMTQENLNMNPLLQLGAKLFLQGFYFN